MMTALTQAIPGVVEGGDEGRDETRREDRETHRDAAHEGAPARWRASRIAAGLAGAIAVVFALGFAMSATFNHSLGRIDGFSDDTIWDWLRYGIQSLVPVSIYAALTLIGVFAGRAVWRIARPAEQTADVSGSRRSTSRFSPDRPVSAAQGLLLLQVVALALIIWLFSDVLNAFAAFADVADRETLSVLNESSYTPILYRQVLTVVLVLSAIAWHALLRRPRALGQIDTPTRIGGASIVVLMVLMLEMPYRLMFQNDLPVVVHQSLTCFELGRRAARPQVLLYCPDWSTQRLRAVDADRVRNTGLESDLFSPPPAVQ
jgi:hypothetical protein